MTLTLEDIFPLMQRVAALEKEVAALKAAPAPGVVRGGEIGSIQALFAGGTHQATPPQESTESGIK